MPEQPAANLLNLIRPGESLTVREFYLRDGTRSKNAVKGAVRVLVARGALREVRKVQVGPACFAAAYAATGKDGKAPDRYANTRQAQMLATVRPGETVDTETMRGRFPDLSAEQVCKAMFWLCKTGKLVVCGRKRNGNVYRLSDDLAADYVPPERKALEAELPPFVTLFTPPLPAFRIKATRVLRPLSSPVEDAA